jgi:ribosomal protein RSM22 (predicted rRNA methylase)
MSYELPPELRTHLEHAVLDQFSVAELQVAAGQVSERYRRETSKRDFQIQSTCEALSYLVARLPATYASNTRVLRMVRDILPDFNPHTVLDIGAGPGTASIAAHQEFNAIETSNLVEPNAFLRQAATNILQKYLPHATWAAERVESFKIAGPYNLVLASYVLNETPLDQVQAQIKKLWDACDGVMVVLEPGTPQGAEIIGKIREFAIGCDNTEILAPCPHSGVCPLAGASDRWCHFAVRTSRTKLHKTLKGGDMGFEDEKFSYIVLSRQKNEKRTIEYRLIGYPSGTKLRELEVCGPNGAETLQVSKSHPLHKRSKKLDWGDGFNV